MARLASASISSRAPPFASSISPSTPVCKAWASSAACTPRLACARRARSCRAQEWMPPSWLRGKQQTASRATDSP
eukprot:5531853-Alexandrium_andersonii.AAC.1